MASMLSSGSKPGSVGLILCELVLDVEVLGSTNADSDNGLDALTIGFGHQLFRSEVPSFEMVTHFGDEGRRQFAHDRLDCESGRWIASTIVELRGRGPRTAATRVEQKVERFENRALAGVVGPENHRPSPRRELQLADATESLDLEVPDAHDRQIR